MTSSDTRGESMRIDAAQSGPIYTYSKIKARRVTDGLSNTLAIGERHIPPTDGQDMPNGEHYWQGDTAFLAADCPRTVFGVAIQGLREDGRVAKPEEGEAPRESFGGPHPGIPALRFFS